MFNINTEYHKLLSKIMSEGYSKDDKSRNIGTKELDSYTLEIPLDGYFPVINTKKIYWKGIVGELLWFMRGSTNIKYLVDNNIHIWDKDAYNHYVKYCLTNRMPSLDFDKWLHSRNIKYTFPLNGEYSWGDLGPVYGKQWRAFPNRKSPMFPHDQLENLISNLKSNPLSRRHIVTAWNPDEVGQMALPPCHWSYEVIVRKIEGYDQQYGFTLKWHQRSVDTFLGLPFNITSYALLSYIIGELSGMRPMKLVGDLSNVHIYDNHIDAVAEILTRDVEKYNGCDLHFDMDDIKFDSKTNLNTWLKKVGIDNFKLMNYNSYPTIKAEMLSPKK